MVGTPSPDELIAAVRRLSSERSIAETQPCENFRLALSRILPAVLLLNDVWA
jgi:hypothetical protein